MNEMLRPPVVDLHGIENGEFPTGTTRRSH